ncbi:MAG: hypothetical protein ABIC95_03690 [archaeon]
MSGPPTTTGPDIQQGWHLLFLQTDENAGTVAALTPNGLSAHTGVGDHYIDSVVLDMQALKRLDLFDADGNLNPEALERVVKKVQDEYFRKAYKHTHPEPVTEQTIG